MPVSWASPEPSGSMPATSCRPGSPGRTRSPFDGSHHHVHGANLGFRGDVYLASGGWNALATAEDHDLWNRVRECGRTLTTSTTCVTTSHRIVGRAPHGFAADMAHLDMAHLDTAQRHMTRREEAVA